MSQDRFEYGTDKTITVSGVTKDGTASTGTGTATYTLTGARGTASAGTLLASGSCAWDSTKSAYVGYIAATTWAGQELLGAVPLGVLTVVVTEGGVPATIFRAGFFCKNE